VSALSMMGLLRPVREDEPLLPRFNISNKNTETSCSVNCGVLNRAARFRTTRKSLGIIYLSNQFLNLSDIINNLNYLLYYSN